MLLKDKKALITGASRGIGKAIAEKFASEGAELLILCSRDLTRLEELKSELETKYSASVYVYGFDINEQEQINGLFSFIQGNNLDIDILVNNAGIMKDAALMMANH